MAPSCSPTIAPRKPRRRLRAGRRKDRPVTSPASNLESPGGAHHAPSGVGWATASSPLLTLSNREARTAWAKPHRVRACAKWNAHTGDAPSPTLRVASHLALHLRHEGQEAARVVVHDLAEHRVARARLFQLGHEHS